MITITDFPKAESPYWKVEDSTGELGKDIFPYDSSDPTGYDRIHVLRQIVDVYSIMSKCKNKAWKTQGSVFILTLE